MSAYDHTTPPYPTEWTGNMWDFMPMQAPKRRDPDDDEAEYEAKPPMTQEQALDILNREIWRR